MSISGEPIDLEESVTAAQALRCSTINAVHVAGRANEVGSLDLGKRANFVVLDGDILSWEPEDIRSLIVLRTVVDGRVIRDVPHAPTAPILTARASLLCSGPH